MVGRLVLFRFVAAVGLVGALAVGCAPPLRTTLEEVYSDPTRFRNKNVEVKGHVLRNVVRGDAYATWSLTLTTNGNEVLCYEEGWNAGVIRQAWDLAEQAREEGAEVVVTGTLRLRYREMAAGGRLDLRSIAYGGKEFHTDYDDFPPMGWAGYPYHPLLLSRRYWPYYYGPFFPFDWRLPHHYPYYW